MSSPGYVLPTHGPCNAQDPTRPLMVPCVRLNNGVWMPAINYGVYGSSLGWGYYKPKAKQGVLDWLTLGGNGIDTAQLYEDQIEVGEAIRMSGVPRTKLFIETKCSGAMGYYAIIECFQDALTMLKTSYVDLLLIHFPTVPTPECILKMPECHKGPSRRASTPQERRESWDAMELIYKSGKARAIGLSDYSLDLLQETVEHARVPPAVLQVIWNPILHDDALLAYCQQMGIQLQAFGSVGGLKRGGNSGADQSGYDYVNILGNDVISGIAQKRLVSTAEVALAWTLQKGVAIALGTTNPSHMMTDMKALKLNLTPAEMEQIQEINPQGYTVTSDVAQGVAKPFFPAESALVYAILAVAAIFTTRAVVRIRAAYAKGMGSLI